MDAICPENHDEFTVQLSEHRALGWFATVERGAGNVALAAGPFKTESAASAWARTAVTGLLRADLEAHREERPPSAIVGGFDYDPPALEGERQCIHCRHQEGEHRIDGQCDAIDAEGFGFDARMRCPCTWFDPPLEATAAGAEVR